MESVSLEFGPTWPNILSVVPFESQGSQEEFKSYKPFVHLCCALAHSFIESGLAEHIPSSVSIFRCLLGSKWLMPTGEVSSYELQTLRPYRKRAGKVRNMLLEEVKLGAKFIPRLRKGERACVKPSAISTLLVPFRERK